MPRPSARQAYRAGGRSALLAPALSWRRGMATVVGYLGVTGLEYALQAHAAADRETWPEGLTPPPSRA